MCSLYRYFLLRYAAFCTYNNNIVKSFDMVMKSILKYLDTEKYFSITTYNTTQAQHPRPEIHPTYGNFKSVFGILCGLLTQNDNCNHGWSKCYDGYCVFYGTFFRVLTVNWTESNWTHVLTIRSLSRKVSPLEHNLWTFSWWWLLWLINVTIWSPVESESWWPLQTTLTLLVTCAVCAAEVDI